jgi:hypothetical protein
MGHEEHLMPKDESTSHVETRAFLQALHDALSQPPLQAQLRATMIGMLNMLSEQNMGIRWAYRERIAELLAEQNGGH